MKHYIEVTLMPSDDIGTFFLWEKVYRQVHLALVDSKNALGASSVGIAFPEYCAEKRQLGKKLRLLAPQESDLEKIDLPHWLNRLTDYVQITEIEPVPDTLKGYVRYSRLNVQSSVRRLARRAAKRKKTSLEQALKEMEKVKPETTNAPFIRVSSLSNQNRFRLFIQATDITREEAMLESSESFGYYGLSGRRGLPHF